MCGVYVKRDICNLLNNGNWQPDPIYDTDYVRNAYGITIQHTTPSISIPKTQNNTTLNPNNTKNPSRSNKSLIIPPSQWNKQEKWAAPRCACAASHSWELSVWRKNPSGGTSMAYFSRFLRDVTRSGSLSFTTAAQEWERWASRRRSGLVIEGERVKWA